MSGNQQLNRGAVDDRQLELALERLAQELQVPFMERRLSSKGRKSAVGKGYAEQLEDAVQEVTSRERELNAAVGIAKMLLGKNKELAEEWKSAGTEKLHLEGAIAQLNQEKKVLLVRAKQESLGEMEEKNKRLEQELQETERKLIEEQLVSQRLSEELRRISVHPDAVSLLQASHQDTMDELLSTHSSEIRSLTKSLQCLEKENLAVTRQLQEAEDQLTTKQQQIAKMEEDAARQASRVKRMREDNSSLLKRSCMAEDRVKYIELDLNMALRRCEKLEEEVKLLSTTPTPSTTDSTNKHERHTSLFSKLHGIEENAEVEVISDVEEGTNSGQTSWRKEMSIDLGNLSADEDIFSSRREFFPPALTLGGRGRTHFKTFTLEEIPQLHLTVLEGVDIVSKRTRKCVVVACEEVTIAARKSAQRKDPSEEYFYLVRVTQATQAVKFSSPYMDSVCTVSAKSLYDRALREGVAFHKWHTWIEDQLTRAYVNNLYSADRRR